MVLLPLDCLTRWHAAPSLDLCPTRVSCRTCRAAAEDAEAELMQVNNQLAELRATEAEIDALEHRYW